MYVRYKPMGLTTVIYITFCPFNIFIIPIHDPDRVHDHDLYLDYFKNYFFSFIIFQ